MPRILPLVFLLALGFVAGDELDPTAVGSFDVDTLHSASGLDGVQEITAESLDRGEFSDSLAYASTPEFSGSEMGAQCCKICRKGKACGDTCIARSRICRVGPGCACNG